MSHKNPLRFFLPLIFIASLNARSAFAYDNFLDTLFSPLRDLDLVNFYSANHSWVDFFIFLFVFIPIAKLTIGRRFGGRAGRMLSVVIGFATSKCLPSFPPTERYARLRLPSSGSLGPRFPTFIGTMLR